MVEYVINEYNKGGFFYYDDKNTIELGNIGKFNLDENNIDEYISDSITHEHIHLVLHKLFNIKVCKLFDSIEFNFRNDDLHKKALSNSERKAVTWHEYILEDGFSTFLDDCNITPSDIIQAKNLCNHRR